MNLPPPSQQVYKYPSMTSVNTVLSMGYLPPGHGYVPKKEKPEKPYGLPFTTVMNRTHRGPGRKHLRYALAFAIAAILFFSGAALYLGHRNVSRMIVYRTEVLGAFMVVVGILCVYWMGRCIFTARVESNKWRAGVRFRPEGLTTAAAYNEAYLPEDVYGEKMVSGTYGPKALKEIPKPKKKGKSRARSKDSLDQVGLGDAPGRPRAALQTSMDTLDEVDEGQPPFTVEGQPQAPPAMRHPQPGGPVRQPPPGGFRPRGPPPPGWRPPPPGFRPRGPPPPGWRPPPPGWRGPPPGAPRPGGGYPPQPQRMPPAGPGPHPMREMRPAGSPRPPVLDIGGMPSGASESEL